MRLDIYADGSCLNNGQEGAKGGWSYVVVDEDGVVQDKSFGKLRPGRHTNFRAELEAIYQALVWIDNQPENQTQYVIHSDSETAVDILLGKSRFYTNKDILEPIQEICEHNFDRVSIKHVMAHADNQINNLADKLAKQGASAMLKLAK